VRGGANGGRENLIGFEVGLGRKKPMGAKQGRPEGEEKREDQNEHSILAWLARPKESGREEKGLGLDLPSGPGVCGKNHQAIC